MGDENTSAPASRLAPWRAGWRVSLRMARRDVRRHRGRSLLVVIMVGLPVLLLTAATTLWFTDDLDASERLPFQLGQSQGYVIPPQPLQLRQLLDPMEQQEWPGKTEPPAARAVPGLGDGSEAAALSTLLHARLVEVTSVPATIRVGDHYLSGNALGVDSRDPAVLAPRVTLDSGRWPASPGEALVTAAGIENGLPRSGTVGLRVLGSAGEAPERALTIVGVGRGFDAQGGQYVRQSDLVTTPLPSDYAQRQWLVNRTEPMTWSEVERLNTYGVGAFSRFVAEHPETMTRRSEGASSDNTVALVIALAALGLVLLTTLLAGPAFAVGAARQRRTLALAASNGATTRQLRRTVLAQALVLGVLSAVVGAALGVAGGVGSVLVTRLVRPDLFVGPVQVPWPAVVAVAAAAVLSSVVAAVLPSRGLGRLDVVSVLRGQSVSPKLRRRVPVVGAVLVAAGAVAVTWASFRDPSSAVAAFVGGSLAIVIGSLLVVPLSLALVARGANRLPLPLRMAAREAGRQRGRATPTVAAIMGGAAVLSVVCIGLEADTTRAARDHIPVTRQGQAVVQGGLTPLRLFDLARTVKATDPTLRPLVLSELADYNQEDGRVMLAARRPGCTDAQVIPRPVGGNEIPDPSTKCVTASNFSNDVPFATLQAADLTDLTEFLDLTSAQQQVLRSGGVATVDPAEVASLPLPDRGGYLLRDVDRARPVVLDETAGSATFLRWRQSVDAQGNWVAPTAARTEVVRMQVAHLTQAQWTRLLVLYSGGPAGVVTTATAEKLGVATTPTALVVRADGGISPDLESRLTDALRASQGDATVSVERGYQRDDGLALTILFGVIGLVILVATLIATALSQTENAPLLGTLAAVGATRRTRRALAGSQALYLGLLGAALGLLVGLAPGIGLARIVLTTAGVDGARVLPPTIPVPWLQILLPVLLVPLVAGALAWVSIRRAPVVVRRAT
ncbi:FtsX-like permease family protein [Terrabacter sp. C0L_2]|uniref:FtsX-like permease family protein n=1 Tax=Terrabacter sp. C0L_2 TaxID=3108389 RepID=UPI002ED34121|nr:FtsX-like permease family protein [Terrabacter sp. C0L_2]